MTEASQTKIRAAGTLLEQGVRVTTLTPCRSLRGRGLPATIDVVLHQPTMAELFEVSAIVAAMGLTTDELADITLPESYAITAEHGWQALRALQVAARFRIEGLSDTESLQLLGTMLPAEFRLAWRLFVKHSGVADFIDSTRLILQVDNLHPMTEGSGHTDPSE